jgi:hypothetical protein
MVLYQRDLIIATILIDIKYTEQNNKYKVDLVEYEVLEARRLRKC